MAGLPEFSLGNQDDNRVGPSAGHDPRPFPALSPQSPPLEPEGAHPHEIIPFDPAGPATGIGRMARQEDTSSVSGGPNDKSLARPALDAQAQEVYTSTDPFERGLPYSERAAYRVQKAIALEARDHPSDIRVVRGPNCSSFDGVLGDVKRKLKKIDSSLTIDHIAPSDYQTKRVKADLRRLPWSKETRVIDVNFDRRRQVQGLAADVLIPQMMPQIIEDGLLDEPKFLSMESAREDCMDACFRMVVGGFTGRNLSKQVTTTAHRAVFGEPFLYDNDYMIQFQTERFGELAGGTVRVVRFDGASLDNISRVAGAQKEKHPKSKLFVVTPIGTRREGIPQEIWHGVVLLGADESTVTIHDPKVISDPDIVYHGGPNLSIKKESFISLWAKAFNRAYLIFHDMREK